MGDIHGCAARLATLHRLIEADFAASPVERPLLVHIGDYVDRGPHSAAVVNTLASGMTPPGMRTVNLRGNHEQMLLDALTGGPDAVKHWLANKGETTLQSWGTSACQPTSEWRKAIGARNYGFLDRLPLYHAVDGYLFVHAGVQPGVTLVRQNDEDLLWIREGFLDWHGPFLPERPSIAIVHGHTPEDRPTVTAHRVGIDTGAVRGGMLTCAVFEDRTVRFLSA